MWMWGLKSLLIGIMSIRKEIDFSKIKMRELLDLINKQKGK
jgi:hypothetical protein